MMVKTVEKTDLESHGRPFLPMNTTERIPSLAVLDDLIDHIRDRTFGRLHDLNVARAENGVITVSAVAHSRFVGQLAEWAVLERIAAADVQLSISLRLPSRHFMEVPK